MWEDMAAIPQEAHKQCIWPTNINNSYCLAIMQESHMMTYGVTKVSFSFLLHSTSYAMTPNNDTTHQGPMMHNNTIKYTIQHCTDMMCCHSSSSFSVPYLAGKPTRFSAFTIGASQWGSCLNRFVITIAIGVLLRNSSCRNRGSMVDSGHSLIVVDSEGRAPRFKCIK